jgi:hypothetical protein
MQKKTKKPIVRFNLQINEDIKNMIAVMKTKHHINISSLCREAVINTYNKLENENK